MENVTLTQKRAGKATGPQQLAGRAHDHGAGGHVDGSEHTPHQAYPGGLQQGGSSRTRSRSIVDAEHGQRDARVAERPRCCVLARSRYSGTNHTHLSELLREREGIEVGRNHTAASILTECRSEEPSPPSGRPEAPCSPAADAPRGHADTGGRQPPPVAWRPWSSQFALLLAVDDATGSCRQRPVLRAGEHPRATSC